MRSLSCALLVLTLAMTVPNTVMADDAARDLIVAAIEKNGGEKLLTKFPAMTSKLKGTVHIVGSPLPVTGEAALQGMKQHRLSISLSIDGQSITYISVLNGDQGWERLYDTTKMSAEKLKEEKESAYSSWISTLVPLKDPAFTLTSAGEADINDRKAVAINVTREGHRPVKLSLDKESLRVVRIEATVRDEQSSTEMIQEATYSEFKVFEGVPHATKMVIKRDGQPHAELEVVDFKLSEKLEDSVFAKP